MLFVGKGPTWVSKPLTFVCYPKPRFSYGSGNNFIKVQIVGDETKKVDKPVKLSDFMEFEEKLPVHVVNTLASPVPIANPGTGWENGYVSEWGCTPMPEGWTFDVGSSLTIAI